VYKRIDSDTDGKPMVVVVDDDEAACLSLSQMLRLRGYRVQMFSSAEGALAWPELPDSDCILTDVKMPGMDGEEFLTELIRRRFPPPVVMVTGHGDIAMAVRCLKSGAYDFVEKPFEHEVILACVTRAVEKTTFRRETERLRRRLEMVASDEDSRFGMVGRSRVMQDVFEQIEVVARSDAPVLIVGETGVGKELVARAIHGQSARSSKPVVAVNAGALPESVLESELFGHAKGAFTGATTSRDGKLLTASGGMLLLDEIESLSLKAQVQLLRVLEDGLVEPVGGDEPRRVDIRLVATTKTDLQELIAAGRMREDFYHRIVVLTVTVPPLRERSDDIPLLVSYFLKLAATRAGVTVPNVSEQTLGEMIRYNWPGNVRELKNAVERMVVTSHQGLAGPFNHDDSLGTGRLLSLPATPGRLNDEMERTERIVIEVALREHRGEVTATAQYLGISRRALYERMKKYGIQKKSFKE
jgi:two-component system C4-dicarboxylate transport response regulator DctD